VRVTWAPGGGVPRTSASLASFQENSVSMSADGRYVAFTSNAVNLVPRAPGGLQVTAPASTP
jgi:hypothetical protein